MLFNPASLKRFFPSASWLEQQQTSILSAALIITLANIISTGAGLIRERLLIASYFDTEVGRKAYEAFLVAFQVPDAMFQLLVLGVLSAAFIPIFSKLRKKDSAKAFELAATTTTLISIVFAAVGIVVAIFAEPITAWRTGAGFSPEQIKIAAQLTRLMLVAQLLFAASNVISGILQSYQRFVLPAIAPVFYNLGIVLGVYLLSDRLGINAAGYGVIIGAFLHLFIQLPLAYKLGLKLRPRLLLGMPELKQLLGLMPARVLTYGLTELQNISLGFFATSLGNLSFFTVRSALRLMTIPIRLFGVPIGQASLAFLSDSTETQQRERFSQLLIQSLHQVSFLAIPTSVLLLILRIPAIRLIFGAHNLPWRTTVLTGRVVAILAISIGAQALVQLLLRAFHALEDTRTPLILTGLSVATYVSLAGLLVFYSSLGTLGLGVATSITAFVELGLFAVTLNHKLEGRLFTAKFFVPQLKLLVSGFLMAVFLYLPFRIFDELIFDTSKTVELIALTLTTSTIGLMTYLYFAALLNVRELELVGRALHGIANWRKPLARSTESINDSQPPTT